jgi:hypothetical protein
MANVKITDLSSYPVILSSASDVIPIVDVTNNITKKITVDNLFAGRGGGGSGTVTSVGMTVPQGLSVTPNQITTSGTFALSWSGIIPANSLAPNPSSTTYLRGDGTWAVPSSQSGTGTVTSIALSMPDAFTVNPPPTSPITSSGTFVVSWNTVNGGKVPPINLGGTPPVDPTTYFLRADGTWANPVGPNVGTVTSVSLTVPTLGGGAKLGLAISGSPITTAGTLALTWDTSTYIPTSVLGAGTANNTTFLRGDGTWAVPSLSPSTASQVSFVSTLLSAAPRGATVITIVGNFTMSDLPVGSNIYFGGDATIGYAISSMSVVGPNTQLVLGTPLNENHALGADVYKISFTSVYNNLIIGSYLSGSVANQVLTLQGVPTPASWLTGPQVPLSNQGVIGQNYYLTSNSAIYNKTDSTVWTEQGPFEVAIDDRSTAVLANNIGSKQVSVVGNGYGITYRLQVTPTNLTANVVIQGFKYITTSATIASVDLTIQAPVGGWTIGYYANFALAMQLAINAQPNALPVTVKSDDANVQIALVTNIPTTFLSPNPPTVASMSPTGVAIGSFISSITIPTSGSTNPIQPAVAQVSTWNWNSSFQNSVQSFVNTTIDSYLETQNWYTATISPTFTYTAVSTTAAYATGWTWDATRPLQGNPYLYHSGNLAVLFTAGQIVTFSQSDQQGQQIIYVFYDSGLNATFITMKNQPTNYSTTNTLYFITGGNGVLVAGTDTILKWTPAIATLNNLGYNNTTGVFTNLAGNRRRFTFSMEVGLSTTGTVISNQASIWFQLNNTTPGAGNRRGQRDILHPSGTGVTSYIMSTSWTFSLAPTDTVVSAVWCDVASSIGTNVFGNPSSARLTIVEV